MSVETVYKFKLELDSFVELEVLENGGYRDVGRALLSLEHGLLS